MDVQGRAFEDEEDWLAYLRDVIAQPESHPEVVAPVEAGLVAIEAAVQGTVHEVRFADAALSLLEMGTGAERAAIQELSMHAAPDAADRLRALLARPGITDEARIWLASELLLVAREDPLGRAVLRDALAAPGDRRLALLGAARGLPEWPDELMALVDPDAALLIALWTETPPGKRRAFIDAVVAAGSDHLDALIAGARELAAISREGASPLMTMLAPHLPDPTSAELVMEAVIGNLRANRRGDPRHAELAERLLHRHELWPKKPSSG